MRNPGNLLAALAVLLLSACGTRDRAPTDNAGSEAEPVASANGSIADPGQSAATVDHVAEPVHSAPPDAVSHPNGFLPPAPGEPEQTGANSSSSNDPPPATEDEYTRNKQ